MSDLLVKRNLMPFIKEDLSNRKMVFLGGPRQVGKTTFAQSLLKNYHDGHAAYMTSFANPIYQPMLG